MSFPDDLSRWTAAEIADTVGCPARIAYCWKKGERQPRPWVQRLVLDRMKSAASRANGKLGGRPVVKKKETK